MKSGTGHGTQIHVTRYTVHGYGYEYVDMMKNDDEMMMGTNISGDAVMMG